MKGSPVRVRPPALLHHPEQLSDPADQEPLLFDGEHDAVLRRRLMGPRRHHEAGASDPIGVQLLEDDAVEYRAQEVSHRLGYVTVGVLSLELSASRPSPGAMTLSTIIVTHDSRETVQRTLPALVAQLREGDQLIVVDNASSDGTPAAVAELAPEAVLIETGANLGFGAGCNRGGEAASGDLLCFLNPDAAPAESFRDAIELPLLEERGWAAWQGLVTSDAGATINTRGGVVHYTGIAWAGGAGESVDAVAGAGSAVASASAAEGERGGVRSLPEPGFVSGACLAIPRRTFADHGGFAEDFFLYHEDVDLSLRLRLAGGRLGVEPSARVDHDYEFSKGPAKWRYLERNRWATLIRTYPAALLLLLTPGLLATELALLAVAASGGWLSQKLAAWADTLGALPRLLGQRRTLQARRTVGASEFARALRADLESPYLGAPGESPLLRTLLRGYWSAVVALLGSPGPARSSSGSPLERSSRSS